MKPEQILEALSYVDEDLLLKSENSSKRSTDSSKRSTDSSKRSTEKSRIIHRRRWGTLAACACLMLVFISLAPRFFWTCGSSSSSSSSSYDYLDEMEAASAEDSASAESSGISNSVTAQDAAQSGETAENAAENKAEITPENAAIRVTAAGCDYRELTFDGSDITGTADAIITDYGITETDAENIPETELGETIATIDDASDNSLVGRDIYQSKRGENLYIIVTEDGYRYFYKLQ